MTGEPAGSEANDLEHLFLLGAPLAALTEGYEPEFFTLVFERKSPRRILTVFLRLS